MTVEDLAYTGRSDLVTPPCPSSNSSCVPDVAVFRTVLSATVIPNRRFGTFAVGPPRRHSHFPIRSVDSSPNPKKRYLSLHPRTDAMDRDLRSPRLTGWVLGVVVLGEAICQWCTMFAHHQDVQPRPRPSFSGAPPEGDARPPKPVPKRRWSIGRLEALFRATTVGEPKPHPLLKQKSHDRDCANAAQRRPMTRWSSAPAESTVWRHGRR